VLAGLAVWVGVLVCVLAWGQEGVCLHACTEGVWSDGARWLVGWLTCDAWLVLGWLGLVYTDFTRIHKNATLYKIYMMSTTAVSIPAIPDSSNLPPILVCTSPSIQKQQVKYSE
jgi:hypothetical protein